MHHGDVSPQIAQGLLALKERIDSAMIPPSTLDGPNKFASCGISQFVKPPCTEDAIHINHSRSQRHWSNPSTTFNASSNGQIRNRRSSCLPRLCSIASLLLARATFTDLFGPSGSLASLTNNRLYARDRSVSICTPPPTNPQHSPTGNSYCPASFFNGSELWSLAEPYHFA